jgi:hypothetical protein
VTVATFPRITIRLSFPVTFFDAIIGDNLIWWACCFILLTYIITMIPSFPKKCSLNRIYSISIKHVIPIGSCSWMSQNKLFNWLCNCAFCFDSFTNKKLLDLMITYISCPVFQTFLWKYGGIIWLLNVNSLKLQNA